MNRLREIRKSRQVTLKELSLSTGISVSFLSEIERCIGKPSLDNLRVLSKVLAVSIDYLVCNEPR